MTPDTLAFYVAALGGAYFIGHHARSWLVAGIGGCAWASFVHLVARVAA